VIAAIRALGSTPRNAARLRRGRASAAGELPAEIAECAALQVGDRAGDAAELHKRGFGSPKNVGIHATQLKSAVLKTEAAIVILGRLGGPPLLTGRQPVGERARSEHVAARICRRCSAFYLGCSRTRRDGAKPGATCRDVNRWPYLPRERSLQAYPRPGRWLSSSAVNGPARSQDPSHAHQAR
jgi:hypothetical protein